MVRLRIVVRSGVLRLRISEGKDRYYKSVEHLVNGKVDLKYWLDESERFSKKMEGWEEANRAVHAFKAMYAEELSKHPTWTAKELAGCFEKRHTGTPPKTVALWSPAEYRDSVEKYLEVVISRERCKPGCNCDVYQKLLNRCRAEVPNFSIMRFSEIDYDMMVRLAGIFARKKAYTHRTKTFRALLGKAHKDSNVDFNLSQIGTFKFSDYDPDRNRPEGRKEVDVLDRKTLKRFLRLNPEKITPDYQDREMVRLYYDVCVFMYLTFFAPCDAIKAEVRDITRRGTMVARRKKTHREVEIPVAPRINEIVSYWKGKSTGGRVFPILNDEDKHDHLTTKDYEFKKFRERLNIWLKELGKELGVPFPLYAYVFRHTAITMAIDAGLPANYIADAAGTSVEIIQKHYYNGNSQQNRNKLTSALDI